MSMIKVVVDAIKYKDMTKSQKLEFIKEHLHGWGKMELLSVESFAKSGKVSGTLLTALVNMLDAYNTKMLNSVDATICVNCAKPSKRKHKKEAKGTVYTGFCQHCKHPLFN